MSSLLRVRAVVHKELRQLVRDPRMMALVLVMPVLQLVLFGYAATFDLERVPVAVLDHDGGEEARALLAAIDPSLRRDARPGQELAVAAHAPSEAALEALLQAGEARLAVVIPPGFSAAVREGAPVEVAVWVDGADPNTASIARASLERVLEERGLRWTLDRTRRQDAAAAGALDALESAEGQGRAVDLRTRVYYNPALESAAFMVPGVLVTVLLVLTAQLSALSIVKEKEAGTFEALLASPARPAELIAGKLLPFCALGFLELTVVLAAAVAWFEVPLRGSVGLLFGCAAAFVVGCLGAGLLLSTLVSTQRQAMVVAFAALIPMLLLSGFIFPIESMPAPFRWSSNALPNRHALEALRAVCLRGADLGVVLPQLLCLLGLGGGILLLASARFRKRVA